MTTFNPNDMGHGPELHFPVMDDPSLYQHNMLDLNTHLDMQYSSRLMDYGADYGTGMDIDHMGHNNNNNQVNHNQVPPTISPMDAYNDPNYIPADSQMLGSSMPVRTNSATSDDTASRGLLSNAYSSATSQSSATPPQREPGYMNPTTMVDQVLGDTLTSSNTKQTPLVDAAPQSVPRKQVEASIAARPEEIADGIFLVNPTGKIVHCNTIVSALLGWSKDKLVGADIRKTLHPEDVNK